MKKQNVVIGIALAIVALLILGLLVGGWLWGRSYSGYGHGMMGAYGFPFGMHTFGGGILMLLVWGLALGGGVLLIAGLVRREEASRSQAEAPLEILKRRYARGEIDRQEFERIREMLLDGEGR